MSTTIETRRVHRTEVECDLQVAYLVELNNSILSQIMDEVENWNILEQQVQTQRAGQRKPERTSLRRDTSKTIRGSLTLHRFYLSESFTSRLLPI